MIVFYRVRGGQDGEDFFDLVEAYAGQSAVDDSFLMRTGRTGKARNGGGTMLGKVPIVP
jgi:hypothetical protein